MDLKVGETQDVIVWAFPKTLDSVQDTLVGRIVSNPTPVEFPISCVGAKPQVEVRLDLPAAPESAAAAPSPLPVAAKAVDPKPAAAAAPAKGAVKKGKEPPPPEPPLTPRSKVLMLHLKS